MLLGKEERNGVVKVIWVKSNMQGTNFHPWRVSIGLELFSSKTLKYAIEKIIESKKLQEKSPKEDKINIFKNKNNKNIDISKI